MGVFDFHNCLKKQEVGSLRRTRNFLALFRGGRELKNALYVLVGLIARQKCWRIASFEMQVYLLMQEVLSK